MGQTASLVGKRMDTEAKNGLRFPVPANITTMTPVATFRSRNWSRFPTQIARMSLSKSASRFLSSSASNSPTQPPSRFARMCTGRSLRGLAGRCQRRPAEVVLVEAAGLGQPLPYLRGKPAVGVAVATARDQAATSLCSQGLLVPTRGQMLRAPLKPGQAAMPSTLVELVKSFNLLEIYLTE